MKKKILIVEDEKSLREALSTRLSAEKFQILEAVNGEEGLAMALREHPDLILLDLMMPVMDGVAMAKSLKKDEWGKTVKIIILTNLSDNFKVQEALKEGVYDYLIKTDWKLEDIVKKVKEKIG